jgi:hypothetical protein
MHSRELIRLTSGDPWRIALSVSQVGPDFLCRIHGGDRHIGAVALSEWAADRPSTGCLSATGHKEQAIATDAAHRLCAATRRTVTCVAGIHFDALTRAEIDEISEAAYDLTARAARELADRRMRDRLESEAPAIAQREDREEP